ncbi:MAG TPA: FtsX-like permease family protein [Thermoanaerobaculia bacterium]|nr:FtsX-like permease family protein [Thermoanaerobaculia bacterium]
MIALLLARRYLLASRKEAQVGVVALAALLGLTLGVAALVVSLALLAGFQTHIRSRLLAETPHLTVTPAGRDAFTPADGLAEKLAALPGVVSVSPVARGRIWISISGRTAPAQAVGRAGTTGLVLDLSQARPLGAVAGDDVTVVSSRTRLSPLGPVPIAVSMAVEKVVPASTGRREPEAVLPLEAARRLFALPEGGASAYEVFLADPRRATLAARGVVDALGGGVSATTWEEANRSLVLALKLERAVLFATVFLIVIVAGLNLAATSAVLGATRAGDAAILAVLGAPPRTVARVFLAAGAGVGILGTAAGALLGTAAAVVLDATRAIPLPAHLYSLAHVPFRVDPLELGAVVVLSVLWSFAASALPARTAARRRVAEVLRAV